ncbi:MAG: hypothetical protein JW940_13425 [Polyangiaceae bacterium]|nr:hypothetical protein [Polyangiaceae bacterium]
MNRSGLGVTRAWLPLGFALFGALVLTPSCGGTAGSGTDSNTHWLKRCSNKEDCGGLECLCGVCTKPCDSSSPCSGFDGPAVCESLSSCADGSAVSVCTAECSRDAECTALGANLTCVDGHCDSTTSTDLGQAGSAGVENTSTSGGRPSGGASSGGTGGSSMVAAAGSGAAPSASGGAQGGGGALASGGAPAATGGNDGRSGSGGSGNAPATSGGTGGRPSTTGGSGDGGSGAAPGGAGPSGAGSTGSDAGAGGGAVTADRLVLDPSSLVFYSLPINSIRYAVTGYDASQRTCATLVWEATDATKPGAFCDVFTAKDAIYFNPYVVLETDTDGPCTDTDWDYQGNVDTASSIGCVDFAAHVGVSVDMVDVEIGVAGTVFTGTIVANNRPEGMVTFGLEYITDIPENVYVQTGGDLGLPEWLHVTKDGARVDLFDHCDVPRCGSGDGVCGIAFSQAANITGGTESGWINLTWDGQVWSIDPENQCLTSAPATPGSYQVEVCYGSSTVDSGSGQVVQDPVCTTQDFTYPTDRVTVTLDNGG